MGFPCGPIGPLEKSNEQKLPKSPRLYSRTPTTASCPAVMPPQVPPSAVIDTNVLLDWLVFRDPGVAPLARAIECQTLVWVTTPSMLDELAHVLQRPALAAWSFQPADVLAQARSRCQLVPHADMPPTLALACSDPDDQKFIDLALALPARWLLSRDKALLRLARRARPRGIEVTTPVRWAAACPPP